MNAVVRETMKMDLPFVNVLCVQTSTQPSAGPLTSPLKTCRSMRSRAIVPTCRQSRLPLQAVGNGHIGVVHVEDVADAHIAAAELLLSGGRAAGAARRYLPLSRVDQRSQ